MTLGGIDVSDEALEALCTEYSVQSLSVFGSRARGDHQPDSDIDIIVEFLPDSKIDLVDFASLRLALQNLIGVKVDLADRAMIQDIHTTVTQFQREEKRLRDAIECCDDIINFSSHLGKFVNSTKQAAYRNAILHQFMVIGQIASHVDSRIQSQYTTIPWRELETFGNEVVHGVTWDRIAETIRTRLPAWRLSFNEIIRIEFGS
jgi:uncharacterized protein